MAVSKASDTPSAPRLRLLVFSDLLLDQPYTWAAASVAEARRAAAREALVEILGAARHHHADVVACAGGLFDRRTIRPSTVQWLIMALRSVNVPVVISPGDRDFIGPLGGYSNYEWGENVTVYDVDRFTPVEVAPGATIWGAAHTEAHRTRSFFYHFHVDRDGVNLALFYGAERSGLDREPNIDARAVFDEQDIVAAGFDHALVGQYQRPHFAHGYTYPGAPIAHSFGNAETGGASLVTIGPGGSVDREYLPITSPPLHDVEIDVTGATSTRDVLTRVKSALPDQLGATHLRVAGRLSPDIVIKRENLLRLLPDADTMTVTWNVQIDADLDQIADEPTIRGQFVRDVRAAGGMSEHQRQRVLLIGLRALAGSEVLEAPQ
jgi:DNA repair exonuclease SbcCD nuclease subunit